MSDDPKLAQSEPPIQVENTQNEKIEEETSEKINWRRFREEREKERKESLELKKIAEKKDAEAKALKEAMEALLSKPNQRIEQNSYEEEESEESKIKKHVHAALAEERKRHDAEMKQREAQELPRRLESNFPDFNQVCSSENVDYLEYHYPEVAAAYSNVPDSFDKWANIYKLVKKLVNNPQSGKDKQKAHANLAKPQSMSVPGVTATGDNAPMYLNDQRKKDNWSRMQARMKGIV